MFDNSTDRVPASVATPPDFHADRARPLLAPEPLDAGPPMAARAPEPYTYPDSVFDRIDPRAWGLVAAVGLASVLLIVAALSLLGGADDASTAAGPDPAVTAEALTSSPDPSSASSNGLPSTSAGQPFAPSTSAIETSSTVPSTTAAQAATSTTTPRTTTVATTTASSSPDPSTTPTDPSTTASTASASTGTSSTETTMTSSTGSSPSTTEAPPTTRPGPSGGDGAIQQQVLDATNAERAAAGCPALRLDPTLNATADAHSEDMAARGYFDHRDPEGRGPGDRIAASGYPNRGWAENIAAGHGSAAAVVDGWMNSSGHRANILNCAFDELGVGYAEPGRYWTQLFATRR